MLGPVPVLGQGLELELEPEPEPELGLVQVQVQVRRSPAYPMRHSRCRRRPPKPATSTTHLPRAGGWISCSFQSQPGICYFCGSDVAS